MASPRRPVDAAPAVTALEREGDVLRHREVGKNGRLLINRRDAKRARRVRIEIAHLSAADGQRPRVGAFGAGHDLDQGRLASAVFAHQRVHLARLQVERDLLQRANARERFADAGGVEECHSAEST